MKGELTWSVRSQGCPSPSLLCPLLMPPSILDPDSNCTPIAGKTPSAPARSLLGAASWRVCGGHREPLFPSKHRDHWYCQHHPAWWQGAGPPELGHGLHPDRRHHQCEWGGTMHPQNSLSALKWGGRWAHAAGHLQDLL